MKTLLVLLPLLLILPEGNGAPALNKTLSEGKVDQVIPVDNLKDQGSSQGSSKPTVSPSSEDESRSDISMGYSEGYLSLLSTSEFPSSITQERGSEKGDVSYNSIEDSADNSEYSASWPSWWIDEVYDGAADVTEDNYIDGDVIIQDIESALIAEKLEPLYQSISHLKSLLYQLTAKESNEVTDSNESASDQGHESYYSTSEDSYASSAAEDSVLQHNEVNGEDAGTRRTHHEESIASKEAEDKLNETNKNMRNNALESSMMNAPDLENTSILQGRRFKRDLGWGLGNELDERFNDANDLSSLLENMESASSWSSLSETEDNNQQLSYSDDYLNFERTIHAKSNPKFWKIFLIDLDRKLNTPPERLERRSRNRDNFREFVESLPTLEGMRKRTGPPDAVDNRPIVPNPGPPYPVPPNLPPPDNVIHPFLPTDDSPSRVQPEATFGQNNDFLEEQTNGVELTNLYHEYYESLKDLERSILMEPIERMASQLAGQPSVPVDASPRFRRVVQIPPPPPYGRKVVKSLYRKKAADYGFPFGETEFGRQQLPIPWDVPVVNEFNAQQNQFDIGDQYRTPHEWGEYVQFGRADDLDNPNEIEALPQLLAEKMMEAVRGSAFSNSNPPMEFPRPTQRELLLQALLNEVEPNGNDQLSSNEIETGLDGNRQWGNFESDQPILGINEGDEVISAFKENDSDGDWDSYINPEDPDLSSESLASDSDISDADWEDMTNGDEITAQIRANIRPAIEAVKHHLLVQKLAQILREVSEHDK